MFIKLTLKSFILDAFGSGILDFLECLFKVGEFGLKSWDQNNNLINFYRGYCWIFVLNRVLPDFGVGNALKSDDLFWLSFECHSFTQLDRNF